VRADEAGCAGNEGVGTFLPHEEEPYMTAYHARNGIRYDEHMAEPDTSTDENAIVFSEIRREPRLSDKVSEMMLDTILSKGLSAGDRLPSERELGEQFGVSRTVVREAVRALVAKGIIEVRSGSGLRVAAVNASAASESLSLYLRAGGFDFEKLHEIRMLLETHIAGLAAERVTDEELSVIRAVHERLAPEGTDVDAAARSDLEFHRLIALATHNELYAVLLDSIGNGLLDVRRENLGSGSAPMTLEQHAEILDRISAHDPSGARAAMAEHLEGVARVWRERTSPQAAVPDGAS
jgi:GntR family transcriptional regulator, transcriptional repressor for pyruvate dehydrogenase complex